MTLHTQFMAMVTMVIGGLYVGFINETFRRFTPLWYRSAFFTYTLEVLFWVSQTALLYYALYKINDGIIRFYFIFALIAGFILYLLFFQSLYIKILNFLLTVVKKIVLAIYKLCMVPIVYTSKIIVRLLQIILQVVGKIVRFIVYDTIIFLGKLILPKKMYNFISKKVALCSTMVNKLSKKIRRFFKK